MKRLVSHDFSRSAEISGCNMRATIAILNGTQAAAQGIRFLNAIGPY